MSYFTFFAVLILARLIITEVTRFNKAVKDLATGAR